MARPQGINDLQILWAIRDIPSDLITFDERSILWALLSIIGNNSNCWYSLDQLAYMLGCSRRFLIKHFKVLERLNFIQISRPDRQGRGQSNVYFLNYELILSYKKDAPYAPFNGNKGAPYAPFPSKRVHGTTEKGARKSLQDIHKENHKDKESSMYNFKAKKHEQKSTVQEWGPGHPSWEALHK